MIPHSLLFKLMPYALCVLIVAAFVWHYIGLREDRKELQTARAEIARANDATSTCKQELIKNAELYHKYAQDLDAVERELDSSLKRMQPQRCICPKPLSNTAATSDKAACATGGELFEENGIAVESLLRFAADCEKVRQNALGWIEWSKKNPPHF